MTNASDEYQDDFTKDPYRSRRTGGQSLSFQNDATRSSLDDEHNRSALRKTRERPTYLPYSSMSTVNTKKEESDKEKADLPATTLGDASRTATMTQHGFRQDSLLTTITTTPAATSGLAYYHTHQDATATTMSLCEELRKQQQKQAHGRVPLLTACWLPPKRWCFACLACVLVLVTALVLFFCWPRLPIVTMASMVDTYGLETPDWGPPQTPYYRTTWQLNVTMDNRPNFVPLHIRQMDLTLNLLNNSTYSSLPPTAFATSTIPDLTLHDKQEIYAIFPINATNASLPDLAFVQLYNACGPHIVNNPPALNVSLAITFHFWYFIWLPTLTVYPTDAQGLICPIS
ncbi:hypothetical protein BC940DRAFT_371879 [Gongronella butleri]|nr:hypothetical protein BC940DRAFT_371879 [Gongronella butleri]